MGYEKYVRAELRRIALVRSPKQNTFSSADILAHFDDWIANSNADIIHINCGLHDIKREKGSGKIAVEYKSYESNIRKILSKILHESNSQTIWATTTPIVEKEHNRCKDFDRFTKDIYAINDIAIRVCQKLSIPINPLYSEVIIAKPELIIGSDGVHFTEEGYKLLGCTIANTIKMCLSFLGN